MCLRVYGTIIDITDQLGHCCNYNWDNCVTNN